jgi:putative peptidoglycan lipid II flippase
MLALVTGLDIVVFLVLARLMRIKEVTGVMDLVAARLPGRSGRNRNT